MKMILKCILVKKIIDKLLARVLSAIAVVAGMTPGELLDDMSKYETGGTA
ncbi:hypothetical protein [Lactiplantibacillus plantarum]|nr:hypothetical protein [Lactiplantibacillus plantarum]